MAMTIDQYVNEVTRVYEQFLGQAQQLPVAELEADVQRMLVHIAEDDSLAEASVTMLPLHSYILNRSTCFDCCISWFGDFMDIVLKLITSGCTKDDFAHYAIVSVENHGTEVMTRLCAAALLRYNTYNPSEKEEA